MDGCQSKDIHNKRHDTQYLPRQAVGKYSAGDNVCDEDESVSRLLIPKPLGIFRLASELSDHLCRCFFGSSGACLICVHAIT